MSDLATRKVFISYSWSTSEHKAAVIELAKRLMADGVDVTLDLWEVKEGHDLISFMEKMVTDGSINKVLIICDRVYAQKANERKGGVGTESQIISPEIYQKVEQSKFVPIVFEHDDEGRACLPVFLKGRLYVDLSSVEKKYENYEQLLRAIFDQPLHKKPSLGTPPSHLFSESVAHSSTKYHLERVKDALAGGKPQTFALIREYLRHKAEELDSYRISNPPTMQAYDDLIVDSIKSLLAYRDEFVEFVTALVEYKNEPQSYDEVVDFFESLLTYHHPPKGMNSWSEDWFDNFKFLTYEMFLYFIAVLIKAKRFNEANQFLEREYYVDNALTRDRFYDFTELKPYLSSIDVYRKQRLKLNIISLTTDLLKERATRTDIGFPALTEADVVLYLRSCLRRSQGSYGPIWYPFTTLYKEINSGSAKLFRQSESRKYFAYLKTILGVDSNESGPSLLQRFIDNGGELELKFGSAIWPISISRIIDFNKLGTRP